MRPRLVTLSILASLLLLATSAFAGTVHMHFYGAAQSGVGQYPVYPWQFSINYSNTPTSLICDSYNNDVRSGEDWTATVTPFLQGVGLFGSSNSLDYKAAGLIFKSMLAQGSTISPSQGQWAIWGLFAPNATTNPGYINIGAAAVDAYYLGLAATAPNSAFAGLVLYTPVAGTQSWEAGGLPQEFIGYSAVPEPSSLMLLGTGLVGIAGAVRRKFAKV